MKRYTIFLKEGREPIHIEHDLDPIFWLRSCHEQGGIFYHQSEGLTTFIPMSSIRAVDLVGFGPMQATFPKII